MSEEHELHELKRAVQHVDDSVGRLSTELRAHDVRLALVEQRQELGEARTNRFEVAMGEAHERIHTEIAELRDESRKTIGEFRADFKTHTQSESDDRRAIIGWLAALVVALLLHGFGVFQWALDLVGKR